MKFYTASILLLFAIFSSVFCDDAKINTRIYPQQYPCKWTESIKVTKIQDDVYHCIHVTKPSEIKYSFIPTANDAFRVMVLDGEGYANYLEEKEFQCINKMQCRLNDRTIKAGAYKVNSEGFPQDYFIIVRNENFIERAFLDVKIDIDSDE